MRGPKMHKHGHSHRGPQSLTEMKEKNEYNQNAPKSDMEPMQLPMNLNIVPSKIYCGVVGSPRGLHNCEKDTAILCVKLR